MENEQLGLRRVSFVDCLFLLCPPLWGSFIGGSIVHYVHRLYRKRWNIQVAFVWRKQAILPSRKCLRVKILRVKHMSEINTFKIMVKVYIIRGKLSWLFDNRKHSENLYTVNIYGIWSIIHCLLYSVHISIIIMCSI